MPAAAGGKRDLSGSFSLRTLYDTNFARSNTSTADQRGLEPKEATLTPNINLRYVQPIGQQTVYLGGSAGYTFHRKNPQLDRARGNAEGGYMGRFGMCGVFATGSFSAAQSDLATLDTPGVKNLLKSTTIAAGTSCSRGRGFSGGVSAQRTETKNSAALQRGANSTTEAISAQVGYGNATLGQYGISYGYSTSDFPNRDSLPVQLGGGGFFTQTIAVTGQRRFGSRMTANASAGISTTKREFAPPGVEQKFDSTNYSAALTYQMSSRLSLALSADRAVVPSGRIGKLYDLRTNAQASGTYKLGSRIVVGFGHTYQDVKSNTDTTVPLDIITNSKTHSSFASVRFQQSDRISVALDVRYDDRSANLPEFNYTATRVGLTAEVGF